MQFRSFLTTIAVISTLTLSTVSLAQLSGGRNKDLEVGSAAPPMTVEWAKGSYDATSDAPYIVEFWATWCAPCIRSIPHLTHLQKEYGFEGLQVIGISVDANTELVKPFVQKQGRKMDYIVGIDTNKKSERVWLDKINLKGIPVVFIVDHNGVIQFIGRPTSDRFEKILKKVMTGRYDQKKQWEAKDSIDAAKIRRESSSWPEAVRAYENAIAIDQIVFAELYLDLFEMYLVDMKEPDRAYALAQTVITDRGSEDPELLTWFAKKIASDPGISKADRRMDVAMLAATSALSFTERKDDPKYLATIATVHFCKNEIDKAIDWQRKAYHAAQTNKKQSFKITLDRYRTQKSQASVDQ
jgi:thiol-disulfide isomerase/thioredoxin